MINVVTGTPFTLLEGKHQFKSSGTGDITLSISYPQEQDPTVVTIEAPGIYEDDLLGCTITPTIPVTAKLDVYNVGSD